MAEFIATQAQDPICKQFDASVRRPDSKFYEDGNGLIVRQSIAEIALQTVVPKSLQACLLYLAHHRTLARHPRQRRMYDSTRQEYLWTHMSNDVYRIVDDCQQCAKKGAVMKHRRQLTLLPPTGALKFIAVNILGLLPQTRNGNQFVVIINDRYSKLTRAIPITKTSTSYIATIILDNWIIPYGVPSFLLTDNGPQFVAELFEKLCVNLEVEHFATTADHPQTNAQVEHYNKALFARLRHYISDNQKDCDDYDQPLTYAYNTQVHRSTKTSLLSLVLSRQPPSLSTVVPRTSLLSDAYRNVPPRSLRLHLLARMETFKKDVEKSMYAEQTRYKKDIDKNVSTLPTFEVGQFVYVKQQPRAVFPSEARKVATASYNKLMPECHVRTKSLQYLKTP